LVHIRPISSVFQGLAPSLLRLRLATTTAPRNDITKTFLSLRAKRCNLKALLIHRELLHRALTHCKAEIEPNQSNDQPEPLPPVERNNQKPRSHDNSISHRTPTKSLKALPYCYTRIQNIHIITGIVAPQRHLRRLSL
jgi:hypothetical protein